MTAIDLSHHPSASPACCRRACRRRISAARERVREFPFRAALRLALAASAVAAAYAFIALMRLRWFAWADHAFTDDPSYRPVPAGDRAPGDPGPQLRVPPILHHLWKNDDIFSLPELWQRSRSSCLGMHPNSLHGRDHYRHMMWTDASMRELIAQKYPSHLSNYDAYPYHIQRVDAARYFILHQFGGIYLDLDIECRKPLDALRRDFAALFPATLPFGVSNDFMMAEPGHPFLALVIEALPRWNWRFGTNYPTVMFSTGPGFLDFQLMAYLARQRDRGDLMPEAERVSIMHRDLYSHRMSSYFQHHHGSSWHQWDAALFWALGFWTRA